METLAIIVNYKAALLTLQAVKSVFDSESIGQVRIVVIDNSEDVNEAGYLKNNLRSSVELIINEKNTGFGCACNEAFERFPGEYILLLNPDARLLPGSLIQMQKTFCLSEKIAAAGPQVFWDDALEFYLPPSYPKYLFFLNHLLSAWGADSILTEIASLAWRYYAIKVWQSDKPIKVTNLSGGHALLKRDAVQKAGGLFDPNFFLYFEDTDLFVRLQQKGYSLFLEPKAEVIHYYDQCGQDNTDAKRLFMSNSYTLFMKKHFGYWENKFKRILRIISPVQPFENRKTMIEFNSPFTLTVPKNIQKGWLFEWSPNPNFLPAAACFGKGPVMFFSAKNWNMLAPGRYFGRLGSDKKVFVNKFKRISWTVQKHGTKY